MKNEVTAFQLGYSTVITLPKELGIKPGQKLKVKQEKKKIVLQEKKMSEAEVRKLLDSLTVDLHLKRDVTLMLTFCSISIISTPLFIPKQI